MPIIWASKRTPLLVAAAGAALLWGADLLAFMLMIVWMYALLQIFVVRLVVDRVTVTLGIFRRTLVRDKLTAQDKRDSK